MNPWEMLEPKTRKFIENLEAQPGLPIYLLSVEDARNLLLRLQAEAKAKKLPAEIRDETLPVGPKGKVAVRIVRPEGRSDRLPVIMYFHGGGWVLGNRETHDRLIREVANGSEAAVVFVNYTPAPDAVFPTQIEEAYAATKYISENGQSFLLDTSRIALVGDSVGGNMAAVVALMAKERGGPQAQCQILLYPVTDAGFETPSYHEFASGPWLTREAMRWFWGMYLPDDEPLRRHPHASPLRAPVEDLKGLPKALIITDENDVLRDEGEAYAHKLISAGVEVKAERLIGTIHDFAMLDALADTPATRKAVEDVCQMLKNVFSAASGAQAGGELRKAG